MPTPLRDQRSIDRNRVWCNRVWPRRPLDLRAQLLTRPDAGGRGLVVHGRTVDLSRSGAGVTVTHELAAGSEVVLCLRLPGGTLSLRAIIARRSGFRVGLEFVQPTAEQRLMLSALCRN
jgi:hypothetical protein